MLIYFMYETDEVSCRPSGPVSSPSGTGGGIDGNEQPAAGAGIDGSREGRPEGLDAMHEGWAACWTHMRPEMGFPATAEATQCSHGSMLTYNQGIEAQIFVSEPWDIWIITSHHLFT